MSGLRFRKMAKTDLPAVSRIETDSQSHPWSLLQFLDGFKAGHEGWVASREYNGVEMIVGFAIVATVDSESSLLNFCVRPAFQNQGYGRELLNFLLKRARAGNIEKFFLEVRESNQAAIHLYESVGFEKISVRKDYYPAFSGREDGLVYSLSAVS